MGWSQSRSRLTPVDLGALKVVQPRCRQGFVPVRITSQNQNLKLICGFFQQAQNVLEAEGVSLAHGVVQHQELPFRTSQLLCES